MIRHVNSDSEDSERFDYFHESTRHRQNRNEIKIIEPQSDKLQ